MSVAARADVRLIDLGSGDWVATRPPIYAALMGTSCPGFEPVTSRLTVTGRHHERFFDAAARSTLDSETEVFATPGEAQASFAAAAMPGLLRCLEQYVSDPGVEIAASTTHSDAKAARYHLVLVAAPSTVYVDYLLLRNSRTLTSILIAGRSRAVLAQAEANLTS